MSKSLLNLKIVKKELLNDLQIEKKDNVIKVLTNETSLIFF